MNRSTQRDRLCCDPELMKPNKVDGHSPPDLTDTPEVFLKTNPWKQSPRNCIRLQLGDLECSRTKTDLLSSRYRKKKRC
ncbi:hypothetical protein HOLleu_33896 [Holothuria leucospilota]|uniref:Uncharacterized protein n=1 Tax=Holothuria leucospilota TaxID=206669 RepID=A0A9Q0YPH5_HOLLE|nr:hypothetical protein HOLleu_33896 [Holothuria leucospilota]